MSGEDDLGDGAGDGPLIAASASQKGAVVPRPLGGAVSGTVARCCCGARGHASGWAFMSQRGNIRRKRHRVTQHATDNCDVTTNIYRHRLATGGEPGDFGALLGLEC